MKQIVFRFCEGVLNYSHSRNPRCAPARTHGQIQAPREPPTQGACSRVFTLSQDPGEDITACAAYAKKQFKIVQSGYAPPFCSGSKLLLKFCATECEQFNSQVYAMLDLVKKFENKYKLAEPKLITTHQDYSIYGPIALIAWLQRDHTELLKDHEWPALARKLPESNYLSKNNGGTDRVDTRTCYKCNKVGHIATYCPDKTEKRVTSATRRDLNLRELPGRQEFLLRGNTSNQRISRSFIKMKRDASGNFAHIVSAKQHTKRDSFN
jgi:hypothetical protein